MQVDEEPRPQMENGACKSAAKTRRLADDAAGREKYRKSAEPPTNGQRPVVAVATSEVGGGECAFAVTAVKAHRHLGEFVAYRFAPWVDRLCAFATSHCSSNNNNNNNNGDGGGGDIDNVETKSST